MLMQDGVEGLHRQKSTERVALKRLDACRPTFGARAIHPRGKRIEPLTRVEQLATFVCHLQ